MLFTPDLYTNIIFPRRTLNMDLPTRIRSDALAARKAQARTASVLVTLMGEIDTKTKSFSPSRPITEAEVVALVRKLLKNIDETAGHLAGNNPEALDKLRAERAALEVYLPAQMSEADIADFAKARIAEGADLGAVMNALKTERAGQYDGRMASGIVRGLIFS